MCDDKKSIEMTLHDLAFRNKKNTIIKMINDRTECTACPHVGKCICVCMCMWDFGV